MLVLAVLFAGVGGFLFLSHDAMEAMSDCPFSSGMTAICPMSLFEHLTSWKTMFSVVPGSFLAVLLLALILAFTARVIVRAGPCFRAERIKASPFQASITNFLILLFSRGLLNPKVF